MYVPHGLYHTVCIATLALLASIVSPLLTADDQTQNVQHRGICSMIGEWAQ